MRRYLKNVFFAVILMIISDFFIGNILEYYYFNVKSGVIFDANESFTKTKSDILILDLQEPIVIIIKNYRK